MSTVVTLLRPAPITHAGHGVVGVDGVEAAAWQLQRDSWLRFEVSHEQPASVGGSRPTFIPSPTFQKRRSGYVFKTDSMGTGYYLDTKAIKVGFVDKSCSTPNKSRRVCPFHSLSPRPKQTFQVSVFLSGGLTWDAGGVDGQNTERDQNSNLKRHTKSFCPRL